MKFVPIVFAFLLAACSTQRVTEYRGGEVMPAGAGAVRTIHGVEIWIDGVPNRPYQIIAVVDDSRVRGYVASRDGTIAGRVKKMGADAAILGTTQNEVRGIVSNQFGARPVVAATARYYVVRYVR